MGRYELTLHVDAPPEATFALWTDIHRMGEWIGGITKVGEPDGPIDRVGTRYAAWFGRMRSDTIVIEVERPRVFATRFGNSILRGTNRATFEPSSSGTVVTEVFETEGVVAALFAWIFGHGTYRGSFKGELEAFAALAAQEAHGGKA
jgi:uncharacterized protein YndB with AHSA1/START domain